MSSAAAYLTSASILRGATVPCWSYIQSFPVIRLTNLSRDLGVGSGPAQPIHAMSFHKSMTSSSSEQNRTRSPSRMPCSITCLSIWVLPCLDHPAHTESFPGRSKTFPLALLQGIANPGSESAPSRISRRARSAKDSAGTIRLLSSGWRYFSQSIPAPSITTERRASRKATPAAALAKGHLSRTEDSSGCDLEPCQVVWRQCDAVGHVHR